MRFEQVIKSVISGNGAQPSKGQLIMTDEELVRFNMELEGVFKDILEHVDQSQVLAVNNLGQR